MSIKKGKQGKGVVTASSEPATRLTLTYSGTIEYCNDGAVQHGHKYACM